MCPSLNAREKLCKPISHIHILENKTVLSRQSLIILFGILLFDASLLIVYFLFNGEYHHEENNWMENLQVVLLATAFCIFAYNASQTLDRHRNISLFFMMMCFIFIFREVDFDKLDIPQWLIFMLAEEGRSVFFFLWLGIMAIEIRHHKYWRSNKGLYLSSCFFIYLGIAAFCLIFISEALDKKLITFNGKIFCEELAEVTAYYFITAAAMVSRKCFKRIDAASNNS